MSKDAFWDLIAEAKKECGQDMDASIQWLTDRLTALGPQQAQDFHDIRRGYQQLADQYGLWSAALILCSNCLDDEFINFRAWLIAQGKEVYLAALRDPDSLADVEPYGDCQFEGLTHVGSKVLEALTGYDAYCTDPFAYDALVAELKQDIVYGEGIGYPYKWNEIAGAFPRLCGKYLTQEGWSSMLERESVGDFNDKEIQAARAAGPKNAPVRRPWDQSAFRESSSKVFSEHDVEEAITAMRAETFREIQNDREFPAGQLAWYWSYIGSLDMAQQLGLITDALRQALYNEAERFKPDCVVTEKNIQEAELHKTAAPKILQEQTAQISTESEKMLSVQKCLYGLIDYASGFAMDGQREKISWLHNFIENMAGFWGLEIPEQSIAALKQPVSREQTSIQAGVLNDQSKADILAGLELYIDEMQSNHEEQEPCFTECADFMLKLQEQWRPIHEQGKEKPDCPLIGEDGNIVNLSSIAARTLRESGLLEQAEELVKRIFDGECGGYSGALKIISEYVNITEAEEYGPEKYGMELKGI